MKRLASEFKDSANSRDTRVQVWHLLSLSNETVTNVISFYLWDDISQMALGKRDTVTVRNKNGKQKLQKRHMCISIKEVHSMYKEENPTLKIGLSRFAKLYPPNVLLSSLTPANVCTCIYHQNMFLALNAIHMLISSIPSYIHEIPTSCLIGSTSDNYWFGTCKHQGCGFNFTYPLPENIRNVEAKWWKMARAVWQTFDVGRKRLNC